MSQATYKQAAQALVMVGSEQRAARLVSLAPNLSDKNLRKLLIEYWTITEAWSGAGVREGMYELLQRVGYISDTEERLEGSPVIYRGNLGEYPTLGHAWTLKLETAQMFAAMPFTGRGWFLGLGRDGQFGELREDAVATVWEARIKAEDILGYFVEREEAEVVVNPNDLYDIRKIQEAR